jgi:hypothetical protein
MPSALLHTSPGIPDPVVFLGSHPKILGEADHTPLFAILYPPLNLFPRLAGRFIRPPCHSLCMNPRLAPGLLRKPSYLHMRISDHGHPFFIFPAQVRGILHRNRDQHPSCGNPDGQWKGGADQDLLIPGDDAASHRGDKDVDGAREELFACLRGRGKGGDCVG